MPWWKALLWLSTQQGSACGYNNTAPLSSVYLEETNSKWKKGRANHLPLRFDTHFSLTQAIFILVQARPSEDLWVSSVITAQDCSSFKDQVHFLQIARLLLHYVWHEPTATPTGWRTTSMAWIQTDLAPLLTQKFCWLPQFMVPTKVFSFLKGSPNTFQPWHC